MTATNPHRKSFLAEPSVQLALALLALALLTWPIVQIAGERGTISLFIYVFAVWAGLIFVLWRIGRAIAATERPDKDGQS